MAPTRRSTRRSVAAHERRALRPSGLLGTVPPNRRLALNGIIRKCSTGAALLIASGVVRADVVFDGTLGPAGALSGAFEISNGYGTQVGPNLFHSFTTFNVNAGESATFTSNFAGTTTNVIGRVTGGALSTIDGALSSTIPGATLWIINPQGLVFGANAVLDVHLDRLTN